MTRDQKEDFMALGERPATQGMRRILCYCYPERCKAAAREKAREAARLRSLEENRPNRDADSPSR